MSFNIFLQPLLNSRCFMIKSEENCPELKSFKVTYWLLPIWLGFGFGSKQTTCSVGSSQKEVIEQWRYASFIFFLFDLLLIFFFFPFSHTISFFPPSSGRLCLHLLGWGPINTLSEKRKGHIRSSQSGVLGIGEFVQGMQVREGGTKGMVSHAGVLWFFFSPFFILESLGLCCLNLDM